MTTPPDSNRGAMREELDALLADRALGLLDEAGARRLDELLAAHTHLDADTAKQEFDKVAQELRSSLQLDGSMPAPVRERLKAWARELPAPAPAGRAEPSNPAVARSSSRLRLMRLEIAAAAALVIVVGVVAHFALQPPMMAPRPAEVARARAAIIAADPGARTGTWATPAGKRTGITGDVVWSDAENRGVLRFRNLPENEPRRARYHVWFASDASLARATLAGVFDAEKVAGPWLVEIAPREAGAGAPPRVIAVTAGESLDQVVVIAELD